LGTQCAPAIKRDLSNLPAGRVGFDDMCGLQTYFDRLAMKIGTPPIVVSSTELQGRGQRSGRSRFTFESDFQLQAVRQILTENWRRLPNETASATSVEIDVRWSERSGVRRVVTNEDAELTVGHELLSLPYHVCLSELLFGEPLYRQRRISLGLEPLSPPPAIVTSQWDGGVRGDGGVRADGGVRGDGGVRADGDVRGDGSARADGGTTTSRASR
jgi:hypothetical protein